MRSFWNCYLLIGLYPFKGGKIFKRKFGLLVHVPKTTKLLSIRLKNLWKTGYIDSLIYIFFIGKSYQIQANQWAIRANVAISRISTAAPYSEYLSIFLATRTNLSNLAVLSNPMSVVVSSVSDPKSNKSNGMAATRSMMNLKKTKTNFET